MNTTLVERILYLRKRIHENLIGIYANRIQCERLCERIDRIIDPLERLEYASTKILSSETRTILERFLQCIEDCNTYIENLKSPNHWYEEIYNYKQTEEKLKDLNERLSQISQDLSLGINIQELFNQKQNHDDQLEDLKDINRKLNDIAQKMTEKQCEQYQFIDKMIEKRLQSFRYHLQQNIRINSDRENLVQNNEQFLHIPYKDLYIEDQPIGRGAFSDVYKARWLTHHDDVAIKILRLTHLSNIQEDFDREISTMYRVRYEHILSVLGACIEPNFYALIVEYMPLGSLADILYKKRLDLDWFDRYSIGWQMAKSINYLHSLNPMILHRDIKSMNFLLKSNGTSNHKYLVKVCDFGLAEIRRETLSQSDAFPLVSQQVGSFLWKAPELLFNRQCQHTKQSDIYSLGMVYWELVTERKPWDEYDDTITVMNLVRLGQRPTIPNEIPENYRKLIEDAWNQDPEKRPSCFQLMERFHQFILSHNKTVEDSQENSNASIRTGIEANEEITSDNLRNVIVTESVQSNISSNENCHLSSSRSETNKTHVPPYTIEKRRPLHRK